MTKRKARDSVLPSVAETICVKGGYLVEKSATVPFENVEIGGVEVRIFRIRKRDAWLLGPLMPTQEYRSAMASELVLKVQQNFQTAILTRRRMKGSKDAEEDAREAARGRDMVGLSQETVSDSGDDVVMELEEERRTAPRKWRKGAAAKLVTLCLE